MLSKLKRYHDTKGVGQLQRQKVIRECDAAVRVADMMRQRQLSESELYLGLQLAGTLSQQIRLEIAVVLDHHRRMRNPDHASGDFSTGIARLESHHKNLLRQQQSTYPVHADAIEMTWRIDHTLTYRVDLDLSPTTVTCVSVEMEDEADCEMDTTLIVGTKGRVDHEFVVYQNGETSQRELAGGVF
ncbi:hypothetical protein FPOAC1_003869 [Fusarium poae]|uniref:hypothetical protein n=1 Tax=Fusarium poae TaxID=36050 RepID=UPI001CE95E0D|nr:hypothetical protein FPOAC1_003869 [Fusarium poae]KAG8677841.1 hypothetical protein FPOAC1_003869 [Fusarium poae]